MQGFKLFLRPLVGDDWTAITERYAVIIMQPVITAKLKQLLLHREREREHNTEP
jgi:hypothetical protein